VGWSGQPLTDRQTTSAEEEQSCENKGSTEERDDALEKLARKQGMNTDIRRAIFVVLMSSDVRISYCTRPYPDL
jgi:nucleolar MIF4G domain-containing protein 1